ncbi:PREDICTED: transport and Golgi organization protein 1 [Drosophila arizonae]|uniref:Transport and Golgi organization protein 1 n=1 Tax=Drosophila arizonae TaxID=7263 RepID=A0ABM1NYG1_DROAR|nr:PREDICTED: transport and Golgi organization protein 1 [Drosophila arizonae]
MRPTNANAPTKTLWSDLPVYLAIALTLSLSSLPTTWALSDKRLCADEKCEQIISLGSAKINYASGENGMLSFKTHAPVRIMSKSAGSEPKLWGVEINGRRGYANKDYIMEKKILIKDGDLKYEVPVVWPPKPPAAAATSVAPADTPAAPAAAAVAPEAVPIASKAQAEQKPQQSLEQVHPVQPVLNASETSEDIATTTTSPLDTLKLAILTEQEQSTSGSNEVPSPITPVQPNLLLVDGTELPLEAVPALTERSQNASHADEIKTATKSNNAELAEDLTTSDDEFDYEDDEESLNDDEDNDNEATLDSKFNDKQYDSNAQSKATDEATATATTPAAITARADLPKGVNEADSQPQGNQAQPEISAKPIDAPLLVETRNVNAVLEDEPLQTESQAKAAEELRQKEKIMEIQSASEANKIDNNINLFNIEPKLQTMSRQITEPNTQEKVAAAALPSQTEPVTEATIEQKIEIAEQLEDAAKVNSSNILVEGEINAEQLREPQPEAKPAQTSGKEDVKVDVEVATAPKVEDAIAPNEAPQQQGKIDAEAAQPKTEEIVTPAVPQAAELVGSSTAGSTVEPTVAPILPSLFNQQHFNNPNEYYKQLLEQQKQQPQEQQQQLPQGQQQQQPQEQQQLQPQGQQQQQPQEQQQQQQQQPQGQQQQQPQQKEVEDQQDNKQKEQEKLQQQLQNEEQLRQQKQEEEEYEKLKQKEEEERQREEAQRQQKLKEQQEEEEKLRLQVEEQRKEQLREQEQRRQQLQQEREQQQRELQEELKRQREKQKQQQEEHVQHTTPSASAFDNPYDAVYQAEPTAAPAAATGSVEPIGLPAVPAETPKEEAASGLGLFGTIMNTVNSFISNEHHKEPKTEPLTGSDELHRLLYPDAPNSKEDSFSEGYCTRPSDSNCHASITLDNFVEVLAAKVLDHSLLLLCVVIAAASSLFFLFTYYCFCNSSQEGALLSKLNHLERSLLAAHKENLIIKHDLMTTRTKLSSIEDNSFGSNDMVAALKKQLEAELYEKAQLQEQVSSLEKDLDNAAEAGLELNKMLSEVLNSQNGDEAFMNTVDELQRQLNDQEKIIIDINARLAEKSRENSELQYSYTESTTRLNSEMKSLQQDNYELEMEKSKLQTRLDEIQVESQLELSKALEARNFEMQRLQKQIMELNAKYDKEHSELQTSLAKIEALEECLKTIKKDGNANVKELISTAKLRGELNALQQKFKALQTKLEQEMENKARLESQLQASSADVEQLKQDFNQSERDKLEAQTRLEVLSGYFREKETQLQKELSLQESKWLQHQGENASTVETLTLMKNEIQLLKSQNDELRAEIEAQIASHKAQMGTLENRAHESWLAARQADRRREEAQAEAAGYRRQMTAMASGVGDVSADVLATNGGLGAPEQANAPSPVPLPLPLPGSPGLLNMPNPLPFLPAPFSPFMGLPPFLPPPVVAGGARPPPLGRMRSPPPTSSSRDRYSPQRDDRDDYSDDDDYYDDDDDEHGTDRQRRHSGSWGRPRRDSYRHSPRTFRSLSPSDSRYNYNETETDFSPPPSPTPPRKNSSRTVSEV